MQEFKLEIPSRVTLSSVLREEDVSTLPDIVRDDLNNGYVWYTFPAVEINKEKIIFSLCFFKKKIQSIDLSISNPELYGGSWNDFSEEKEKARAKAIEQWLSNIGYKTGKYSWGEVWAGYNSKSGSGLAVIRYAL